MRKSIIGPLLLIGIGVIFLLNNVFPEFSVLQMLSRYWPFLLIGWGVLRLAEVLYWAAMSKPLPSSGVSGGEWALVVLLCLFGSGLFFFHNIGSRWPSARITSRGLEVFGESYDFPVKAQAAVASKTPKVVIENWRGNARITGGDASEVVVTGRKTVRAFQQSEADQASKQTPLEVTVTGEQVFVRANQEKVDSSRRVSADLDIVVPRGASVECRGRYGDFDVTGITGSVDVNSDNAGVRVENIGGMFRADLRRSDIIRAVKVKGAVEVKGRGQDVELEAIEGPVSVNGSYSGELVFRNLAKPLKFESSQTEFRVERVPGMIRMALGNITADNIVGPVRLQTKTRDVQLRGFTNGVEIVLDRGDVELRPFKDQLGRIDVRTKSGDIDLALVPGSRFDLRASTSRGEVQNDFGAPLQAESGGRGATLKGSAGQGPQVQLNTDRGNILVRKGTGELMAEAEPPPPPKAPKPPTPPVVPPKSIE